MEAEQRGETWKWKGGGKERQARQVMSLPDVTSHYNRKQQQTFERQIHPKVFNQIFHNAGH